MQHSVTFKQRHSSQIWYPLLAPVSRYWPKLRRVYFPFPDFCHNSRTSNDIDMKLGPVTKLDKRNTATSKKMVMTPCQQNVIVIFPIYGQFWAIRKSDSGRMVCKMYIFINSSRLSYKNWKQNKNVSNTALILSYYCFE